MTRKSYPTDLNDMEWEILAPLIPPAKLGGHPRTRLWLELLRKYFVV